MCRCVPSLVPIAPRPGAAGCCRSRVNDLRPCTSLANRSCCRSKLSTATVLQGKGVLAQLDEEEEQRFKLVRWRCFVLL